MTAIIDVAGFVKEREKKTPFSLKITGPHQRKKEIDYFCRIRVKPILNSYRDIYGVDGEQAKLLAINFVKSILSEVKIVDRDGDPIHWENIET
jgi:hypothetical protein